MSEQQSEYLSFVADAQQLHNLEEARKTAGHASIPVWCVIVENDFMSNNYMVFRIVKSIACMTTDKASVFEEEVLPLINQERHVSILLFYREPENPFRTAGADWIREQERAAI